MKTLLLILFLVVSCNLFAQNRVEIKTIGSDSCWNFSNTSLGDPYVGGVTHGFDSGDSLQIYDIVSVAGINDTCVVTIKRFDTNTESVGKLIISSSVPVHFVVTTPFVHNLFIKGHNVVNTAKIRKESKNF